MVQDKMNAEEIIYNNDGMLAAIMQQISWPFRCPIHIKCKEILQGISQFLSCQFAVGVLCKAGHRWSCCARSWLRMSHLVNGLYHKLFRVTIHKFLRAFHMNVDQLLFSCTFLYQPSIYRKPSMILPARVTVLITYKCHMQLIFRRASWNSQNERRAHRIC